MIKKSIVRNLASLKSIRERKQSKVNTATLQKINNIIDLYEDRKIVQFGAAEKLIKGVTATGDKEQKKGLKAYDKAVQKYQDAVPIGEREKVKKATEKAVKGRKAAVVDRRVRSKMSPEQLKQFSDRLTKTFRERVSGNRHLYSVKYCLFSLENRSGVKRKSFVHNDRAYYPLLPLDRTASIKAQKFIERMVKEKVDRFSDKPRFKRMMGIMRTDKEFDRMVHSEAYNYVDLIRLESAELIDESDANYDVFADELTNSITNVSVYHRYISTEVDADCLKFKDAIKNDKHIENECWINTLIDHYADTLMKTKRGKLAKNLTRDKIIEIINKTNEEFKRKGASINEMDKVFREFNIKARLYDIDSKLIYRHDPEDFNSRRVVTFNGLVNNSHIYTLNHDLKSLKRQTKEENPYRLKNNSNYYINDRKEPMKFKMISCIDDILTLNEEDKYNIVLKDNDLNKMVCDLRGAGYDPQIRWRAGKISDIKMELTFKKGKDKKKVLYDIVSQDLDADKIDEDIEVSTEEKYNRVSEEMFRIHKSIFNETHKSYYNNVDVEILNECRTIVPNGRFANVNEELEVNERCSIDKRKAFTHAGGQIVKIPVFKEFDVWKPYDLKCDFRRLGNYTLYVVQACQGNIFFNKKYNLVYEMHLKDLVKRGVAMKILEAKGKGTKASWARRDVY